MIRLRFAAPIALAVLLAALPAAAQDATEQAKVMFNAGAQAYEAGKYPAAVQAFTEAYRLSPRPGILFSIAQAYRRQYTADKQPVNLRAAIKHYRDYVAKVEQGGRRADAVQALSELEPMAERLGAAGEAAAPPPVAKPQTQLMVSAQTKEALIALDGGKPVEAPLIAEVKPGKHRIHVEAPGFFPEDREVQAADGGVVALDISMREKPGLLTVVARDGTDVSIDGRVAATTPLARPIEVAPGRHFVALTKRGYKAITEDVDIGRGETKRVDGHLEMTGQRVGAYVLMGIGAAAVVSGGVLAGLAVREQRAAQTLDEKRLKTGALTLVDFADYQRHVRTRDDLRRAGGVALGGGVVLGATAVMLAVFDQPVINGARRDAASRPGAPAPVKDRPMEISAAPILLPGFYGASFTGSF
ncbi:MAG: PEGA domain-containing protein [Minicystis sp.]